MGRASRKAADLAVWKNTLLPDEQIVFAVAESVYRNIVRALGGTGFCYRASLFLTINLREEHDLRVEPVVGFVNDGEGDVMASHAWVEFNGKKTDLALTLTDDPIAQPPEPLLILDRKFGTARTACTYHREQSPAGLKALQELALDPTWTRGLTQGG